MIKGFVEALRPFQVRGWVHDDSEPGARLRVCVRVDGRKVGAASADLFRGDLATARIGDGKHGFVVMVTETLPLHRPASILVEAADSDDRTWPLPAISGLVIDAVNIARSEQPLETSITGFFSTGTSQVEGWAYDVEKPNEHLEILIEIDGIPLGRTRANVFYADLVLAGIGNGDHGFTLSLPVNGRPLQASRVAAFALSADNRMIPLGIAVARSRSAAVAEDPVFPGASTDSERRPVIILGAARSGTSATAQALITSGGYTGFEEGHFLDLLVPLLKATTQFYESRSEEWAAGRSTHLASVKKSFVEQGLKHIILEAAKLTFPEGRWVDKTPRSSMIAAAPLLRSIWPNAKFIYMRRRAIENLGSRLRKFPNLDFEAHCQEWALSIRNWYAVADTLSGAAMEIDQFYMAMHPAEVASALRRFLGLSEPMTERLAQALTFDQPERTAGSFGVVADIHSLGWSADQIEMLRAICGPTMRQAGYAESTAYFQREDFSTGIVVR